MGTLLGMQIRTANREASLRTSEMVLRAIEEVEGRLSTWREDTELAGFHRIPAHALGPLSNATMADLRRACHWAAETKGAFDPTVGALVQAYNLRNEGRWPSAEELRTALANTGVAHLSLTKHGAIRSRAGLRIEEGAFGKGAGLDAAAAVLKQAKAEMARIDLGGQWLLFGQGAEIEIADPRDRSTPRVAWRVPEGSVATSGNSERGLVVDGRRLGHVIDPRTGRPAEDFGSVSVWCPKAIDADCLATAMFVMGPTKALAFAEQHKDVECVVIRLAGDDIEIHASTGARRHIRALP